MGHASGRAVGQAQVPPSHTPPVRQPFPHTPQFRGSVATSTQVGDPGAQRVTVAGAASQTQAPAPQVPRPQAWPHAPQLSGSAWRSTQAPLHSVCPAGQTQAPPVQLTAAAGQAWAQLPQWARSVWRSAQMPLQSVSPWAQSFLLAPQPSPTAATSSTAPKKRHEPSPPDLAMEASRATAITRLTTGQAQECCQGVKRYPCPRTVSRWRGDSASSPR